MNRCLLCDNDLSYKANMFELIFIDDVICFGCRNLWIKNKKKFILKVLKLIVVIFMKKTFLGLYYNIKNVMMRLYIRYFCIDI